MRNKNVKKFIEKVQADCKKHGIKLDIRPVNYLVLSGNIRCSGYFDEVDKVLVVAGKKDIWLGVLVHEYAHLTQWVDGCKEWIEGCEGLPKVDEWLAGKRVHNIQKHLARSRDLELDNEKRSVKLIKKYKLPIDVKSYVQRANAYVQFYNWMFYTRRWSSEKNSPYGNPNVYEQMPTKFSMNYETMSDKYKTIYKQNNI